jgi:hypothetical protein
MFNTFYIETIRDLKWKIKPQKIKVISHDDVCYNQNSMSISPVTENRVKNVINRLMGSLSAGFDDVPEVTIKYCAQLITIPLAHILNLSSLTAYFPDMLKTVTIQPIFKRVMN